MVSPPVAAGDRRQVLDPGVEPRTGAERVGEDPVEGRHQPQALVEVGLVLDAAGSTTPSRLRSAGLRSARDCLTSSVSSLGEPAGRDEQAVHGLATGDQRRNSTSLSSISVTMSSSRSARMPETVSRFCSSALICSSRLGHVGREPREALQRALEAPRGCPWSASASVLRDLREPVGVDPLGAVGQAGERLHDVVRRLGAADAGSWSPPRAGRSRRARARGTSRPSRVLTLICGAGLGAELGGRVDLERRPSRGRRRGRRR